MARGSVERRGDRFRAVYRVGAKKHTKTFDHERDADRWLVDQLSAANHGQHRAPADERTTMAGLYAMWIDRHPGTPTTLKRYDSLWRNHIVDTWGDVQLGEVRIPAAEKWVRRLERTVSERTGEVLSASTISGCHAVLYAMLTYAVKKARLLSYHPLLGMEHPKVRPAKVVPPTLADVTALLGELREDLRPILIMEAGLGLRYGEAAGLTVDRLDLTEGNGWAQVVQQVHTGEAKGRTHRVADPKMRGDEDAGKRPVPVAEWAAAPLRDWLRDHPAIGKGTFVARMPDGSPVPYDTYNYNLNRAQDRLWGERRYTGHDLRHFYVSMLIAAGVQLTVIQRYIGHVPGSKVTERIYAHLVPGHDTLARAAFDQALVPTVSPQRRRRVALTR